MNSPITSPIKFYTPPSILPQSSPRRSTPKSSSSLKNRSTPKSSSRRRRKSSKSPSSCDPFKKGDGRWRTVPEIREHLVCVPDRRKTNQYFHVSKRDKKNNAYEYFGLEKDMNRCVNIYNEMTDQSVTLEALADCDITKIANANPDYALMLQYLQNLYETGVVSTTVLQFLQNLVEYTNLTMPCLQEIINGAFTIIRGDTGYFYEIYKTSQDATQCSEWLCGIAETSHDSIENQYRLGQRSMVGTQLIEDRENAPISHIFDLLVGTSVLPGDLHGSTWFQFEYARLTGDTLFRALQNRLFEHLISFVKYKASGKNQGVFGGSPYAEYNRPLILDLCKSGNTIKSCASSSLRRKTKNPLDVTEEYWDQFPKNYFKVLVMLKNLVRNVIFTGWTPAMYHATIKITSLRNELKELTDYKLCANQARNKIEYYTISSMLHDLFEHVTTKCISLFR